MTSTLTSYLKNKSRQLLVPLGCFLLMFCSTAQSVAAVSGSKSGINGMTNCSTASKDMVLAFASWVEQSLGVAAPSATDHAGCA